MVTPSASHMGPVAFDPPKMTAAGTLADRVTAVLLEKIKNGEFPTGSRLPTEQVISERFGVSRTVVREAISRLKSDGLVEVRQGSGTVVREANRTTAFRLDIDPKDSIEAVLRVTELRRGVEAEAAALAAQRRTRAQLADIKRALGAIDAAVKQNRDGVNEDLAFHIAISQATGNPLYPSLLEFISQFIHAAIRVTRTNEARRNDFSLQVREEHSAIFDAIAARDPVAARRAAITHIDNAGARIKAADTVFWASEGAAAARPLINQERKAVAGGAPRAKVRDRA
ncbi:MAG: GntR family transcriptional regulator, transcriptional repressor for pyruvate dehydrogenase complex [Caballeronia sp.]|jgi:GntR family transcriptional regulator, transcriptional repressor for pyruvate dehydrogenase complex|nr:GntR family transcriptional regulator, transcriptional repressor for pyruvate dehydrogenase complex [Caballeronia sp.]MEA3113509.1 GntR family transcriptional regulator, transcriptional repressor for pyruvate dehydrogenase complex [Caballeronia sp.]MEA3124970.1 GntR family transcriptional regulator, transcriptional repressor for pyruvate dehydrogenase complex [Caballeronia sp.]